MKVLTGMTKLESLTLRGVKIRGPGLKYLEGLGGLRELNIASLEIGNNELKHLSVLTGLKSLRLGQDITPEGLAPIAQLRDLESLDLHAGLNDKGLENLRRSRNSAGLRLNGASDAGLACLEQMTGLESVMFFHCNISDAGLGRAWKNAPNSPVSASPAIRSATKAWPIWAV